MEPNELFSDLRDPALEILRKTKQKPKTARSIGTRCFGREGGKSTKYPLRDKDVAEDEIRQMPTISFLVSSSPFTQDKYWSALRQNSFIRM